MLVSSYKYNDEGIRTSKIECGVEHKYILDGTRIISETWGDTLVVYLYDEAGSPIGMQARFANMPEGTFYTYFFEKNIFGDIIAIYDTNGVKQISYTYDAFGKFTKTVHGSSAGADFNNLLYRGYYFDWETGFYYLNSRYYDPLTCRFINADSPFITTATPMSLTDKNLFAYCDNNPVMRVDEDGEFWDFILDIVSVAVSVVDVIKNPDDPMAWAGLALDVVSLAVPFATGGGLLVDAVTKSDDIADTAKVIAKQSEKLDAIKDAAKSLDKGENFVYYAFDEKGILEYVGITNDFDRRHLEHLRTNGRNTIKYISGKSRESARVIEQTLIETFGRAGKDPGGILNNIRNSISPKNSLYKKVNEFKSIIRW